MWWLSYHEGVLIMDVEASSITHARLIAAAEGFGRVSHFEHGYYIDPDDAARIPDNLLGRMLSVIEIQRVRELLRDGRRGPRLNPLNLRKPSETGSCMRSGYRLQR
jgi:hypothetical protein